MKQVHATQIGSPYTDDNWLQVLEAYAVQFVVLNQRQDDKLVKTLRQRPDWVIDFEGDGAVIFARAAQKGRKQYDATHPR